MKRAVITGPTGSIGLALINELVSNGVEVVAVVRPGSRRADRIKTSDICLLYTSPSPRDCS